MKNILVPSKGILLSNSASEGTVYLYADLIARGVRSIHRVVVADVRLLMEHHEKLRGSHVVLEGNNTAVAYALLREKVPCTLVENDQDLLQCRKLSDTGKMRRFVHEEKDFQTLVVTALDHARRRMETANLVEYARFSIDRRGIEIDRFPQFLRSQIILK